jgi:hypothetical protein
MSASVLITNTVDGPKIRQGLLPATPVATPTIVGGDAKVDCPVPGFPLGGISVLGADSGLAGAFQARSGGNKGVILGEVSGKVALGDGGNTGKATLTMLGTSGPSPVYNKIYDPVLTNVDNHTTSTLITDHLYTNFDLPEPGYYGLYVSIITGSGLSIPANSYYTFGLWNVDANAFIWKQTVKASDLIGPDGRTEAPQFQFGGVPKFLAPGGKPAFALGWQSSDGAGGNATWNLGAGGEVLLTLYALG